MADFIPSDDDVIIMEHAQCEGNEEEEEVGGEEEEGGGRGKTGSEGLGQRVVIVGAGISGLVAAIHLRRHGFRHVLLLEAQTRVGGRVHTIPYGDSFLELGAQWIHGEEDNPLFELAVKNDLVAKTFRSVGEGRGHYLTQDGGGRPIDPRVVSEVNEVVEQASEECCALHEHEEKEKEDVGVARLSDCNSLATPITVPTGSGGGHVHAPNTAASTASIGERFQEKFEAYLRTQCQEEPEEVVRLKKALFRWHLVFQCLDNACYSMRQISAATWGEFRYFKGEHCVSLQKGYKSVVEALLSSINALPSTTPTPPAIRLNTPVEHIEWGGAFYPAPNTIYSDRSTPFPVRVTCRDGSTFHADHVIVTVSLGVLKHAQKEEEEGEEEEEEKEEGGGRHHRLVFEPPLPPYKRRVIRNMGFGSLDKIFLEFEEPFWDVENGEGFQFVWTGLDHEHKEEEEEEGEDGEYTWYHDITGFDVVPNQPHVLMGWIGRKGAELMEKLSDAEVKDTCAFLLRKFTARNDIPKPKRVTRSKWSTNPYFRGAYSFRTVKNDIENSHTADLAKPVFVKNRVGKCEKEIPALLFAGEATHPNYFSTVHGAFLSGKREAQRIIEFHQKQKLNENERKNETK